MITENPVVRSVVSGLKALAIDPIVWRITMTPEMKLELLKWGLAMSVPVLTWIWGRILPRLPSEAQKWYKEIGGDERARMLIAEAAQLAGLDGERRRAWVVKKLTATGMPTSTANLITEWAYNKFRRKVQ